MEEEGVNKLCLRMDGGSNRNSNRMARRGAETGRPRDRRSGLDIKATILVMVLDLGDQKGRP
jgi:hypothetical protein